MAEDGSADADAFGLQCWSGTPAPMRRAHRHDDIEVNVVGEGRLDYLFGARRVSIPAGSTSVFWAALPHQLVSAEPGSTTRWLTVPLATVLRWRVADHLLTELLDGEPLLAVGPEAHEDGAYEADRFVRWSLDLAEDDDQLNDIVLLEIEAYLRRVLRQAQAVRASPSPSATSWGLERSRSRAATMAGVVATRFREPLGVDDVAAAVHLTPHYAMTVFREAVGATIGSYLAACRLAEAQRLLITSRLTVATVAHAAGFGSLSRLYAAFADAGLPAPAAYRRLQQRASGGPTHGPGGVDPAAPPSTS